MNNAKIQGPGLSVKFLGVIWLGKTKVITEAVIDKIQDFPCSTLLGYWRTFIPHLAQMACPLYALVKKRATWDWTKEVERAFLGTKRAV